MTIIKRTNSEDSHFQELVTFLNKDLLDRYGDLQDYYSQFNTIQNLPTVVVAYYNEEAVGCGCFKKYDDTSVEVKRMYVAEDYRGLSIAENILKKLEAYAVQNGIMRICLETGNLHTAALAFYRKSGYHEIVAFGNYQPNEVSIYFEKICSNV